MTTLRYARSDSKWARYKTKNGHKFHFISDIRLTRPQKRTTHTNLSKFIKKFFYINFVESLTEVSVNRVNLGSKWTMNLKVLMECNPFSTINFFVQENSFNPL